MGFAYDSDLRGEMSGPTVLCRIVDASAQEDLYQSRDDDNDDEDLGMVWTPSMTMIWAILGIAVIVML